MFTHFFFIIDYTHTHIYVFYIVIFVPQSSPITISSMNHQLNLLCSSPPSFHSPSFSLAVCFRSLVSFNFFCPFVCPAFIFSLLPSRWQRTLSSVVIMELMLCCGGSLGLACSSSRSAWEYLCLSLPRGCTLTFGSIDIGGGVGWRVWLRETSFESGGCTRIGFLFWILQKKSKI